MPLCSIFLDRSNATYYPGETVTGWICVNNPKPMKVRSVTMSWSGVSTTSMGINKPTYKKTWLSGSELMWVPKDEKSELSAGVREFPFSINLPLDCPPTHKMRPTKNAYKLEVVIDRPWRFNTTVEKKIIVTKKLDTTMTTGSFQQTFRSGRFFNSGPVTIKLTCPIIAQAGETVNLNVKVINNSSTSVTELYTYFRKQVHYHARFQYTPCKAVYRDGSCPLSESHHGYNSNIARRNFVKVNVAPYSEQEFIIPRKISKKATTPNFANGLMAFGYFIGVGFAVSESMLFNDFPVTMNVGVAKEADVKKEKKQEALGAVPPPYSV